MKRFLTITSITALALGEVYVATSALDLLNLRSNSAFALGCAVIWFSAAGSAWLIAYCLRKLFQGGSSPNDDQSTDPPGGSSSSGGGTML